MAVGEIILCTGPEDLYRRAEDLLQKGIQTEFIARNTMRVVKISNQISNISNITNINSRAAV